MINLPALRWGKPYESLDVEEIRHFLTGEPVARVSTVGAGIIKRDARHARRARLPGVKPNAAHYALAELEEGLEKKGGRLTLVR